MATGRKVTHAKNNEQFGTSDVTGDPFYFLKVAVSGGKTYWNITVAASFDKPTDQVGLNLVQSNSNVVGWQDDPGSQWELELINDDEITIQKARESVLNATKAPQIEDGKYYYFRNMLYGTVMRENFGTAASGVVYTADRHVNDYAEVWRAVKDENGYKLQNIASGRYVMRAASKNAPYRTGADDKAFTFTTEENSEYRYERAYNFKHETTTTGMSCNNAGNVVRAEISNDGPNNAGSEWGLESIEISEAQLAEAKVQYEEYLDILQNAGSYIKAVETFFADKACTDLKDEYKNMTDEQLKAAIGTTLNSKLTDMVLKIKNDKWASYTSGKNWEKRFRVQEYGAFSNREAMGQKLRLNPWSSMNGPTGITSGNSSSPIYVFVDEFTMPSGGKLYAEFIEGANINNPLNAITLKAGLNILTNEVPNVPLFITYETKAHDPIAKYTPIKIHIEGGDINGYFDTRDQSDEDWVDMWNDGLFTKSYAIDVVGKFAQWHMNAQKVKAALNNKPVEVMQIWDRIVELQVNLMGVHKSDVFDDPEENLYPSVYNNRMAGVSATKNYMWSQNGGTFYEEGTIASVLNYENMNGTGALWGPAHEIGHNNQAVIKLAGTTEVSNNLFSNMVVYEFGKITTRYWNIVDRQKGMHLAWPEYYARGREVGVGEPIASMNRMFFTLYLYYHVLGNKPDFYQQVFKSLRHDPIVNYGGGEGNETITNANTDYLKFAKVVCDVAQEDLTEYFDYWGFLKPCDEKIGDYANFRMVNTDAQIKEFRDYIKSKGYRKNGNILFLDDRAEVSYQADGKTPKGAMEGYTVQSSANKMGTFTAFKANAVPTGYSATVGQTTGTVTIKAGTGAVGYKIYDADGNLVYVATTNTFAIPNTVTDKAGVCIVAAAADPANDVVIYGELAGIDNVSIDTNEGEQVIYDLSGRRVQKAQSGLYIINGKKVLVK